ncbi:hypothetical protein BC828DRAFT_392375 [Blastocladiella britannica]|nr:hypothetical protein BC828DRAFT_392375 [Blastocladiella britannica]
MRESRFWIGFSHGLWPKSVSLLIDRSTFPMPEDRPKRATATPKSYKMPGPMRRLPKSLSKSRSASAKNRPAGRGACQVANGLADRSSVRFASFAVRVPVPVAPVTTEPAPLIVECDLPLTSLPGEQDSSQQPNDASPATETTLRVHVESSVESSVES